MSTLYSEKPAQPINVLISLYRGYGLGDCVQMSAVLRHVAAAHPEWTIGYQAENGRHGVGRGIVANTFAYGEGRSLSRYDAEVQIILYDTWMNWRDRPNTRVATCLRERFGMDWRPEFGRYQVKVDDDSMEAAHMLLSGGESGPLAQGFKTPRCNVDKIVAVHYQGDSAPHMKNLDHEQASMVCEAIKRMGYEPLILDWRKQSPLVRYRKMTTPSDWGKDAEMICAVIRNCAAFVGIDSGPAKCASATDTPTLVVWTGHHPAPFHDPAPNTTHLVPYGYHGMEPVCGDSGVIDWFEAHYKTRQYQDSLVRGVEAWLEETLR